MSLSPDQIQDFVQTTFSVLVKKDAWKDISLSYQRYIVAEDFLNDKKMSVTGGPNIRAELQVRNTGTYEKSGWFATTQTKIVDMMENITVPWTMARVSMAYSIYEDVWQQGPQRIVSYIKARKQAMNNDLVEGLEFALWDAPTGPNEKPMSPWGMSHWFQRSTGDFGFNGQNPSGFSDMAGLDATMYPNWRNGTFSYSAYTHDDFYGKLAEAMHKSHFTPPRSYAEIAGGKPQYQLRTSYNVVNQFFLAQTAANDNLRMDIGKWYKGPLFRGVPVEWVPVLDNPASPVYDATDPIYGIDRTSLKMFYREGREKTFHPPMRDSSQPDVIKQFVDLQWNWIMMDRRKNFIGYKV